MSNTIDAMKQWLKSNHFRLMSAGPLELISAWEESKQEEAQTVEPGEFTQEPRDFMDMSSYPQPMSRGEREALIEYVRGHAREFGDAKMHQAADMLAADAKEIEHTRKMYKQAVQGRSDFRQALREAQKVAVPKVKEKLLREAVKIIHANCRNLNKDWLDRARAALK